ncbi:importin subunit beta-1-like [Triticum dicoccoides]|uniref:importin subunit beta-1-like n=1 Tax=Triticum dicoccoides TaxID=85692 RepID=UPI00188E07F8|nr:importin subunit beta-1-like [Triticum dicoccoides]
MDITKVLLDAQHRDNGVRSAAEADLKRLQELDLPSFLVGLSSELSSDDSPAESRRLAGTILNDSLCSSDIHPIDDPLVQRWFSVDPSIGSKIKESSLTTVLASPVADARRASSQIIAKLARIEEWPDLLHRLLGNAAQRQGVSPIKQQAALEALEHVFKNNYTYLKQDQVDDVLNALIVEASRVEDDLTRDVRLAAVRALQSSKDVPEVSEKVSGAIYFLARGYGEDTKSKSKPNSPELSPYVRPVIDALLSATEPTPFGLPACASAYEALTEIVRVSNTREFEASLAIRTLMPSIMRRLNMVLNHDGVVISSGDKMNRGLLEVLLCGLVQLIIEKMGSWDIIERSALRDSAQCVLLLLCRALTSDSSSARDKAALAIGALAHSIGPDFGEHMPMLLQYFTVKRLSPTYLEVMCDICHVLGDKVAVTCCDQIMDVLYKGMSDVALIHSIMACFGEIALDIGWNFERYLETVMKMLKEAANGKYRADVSEEGKVEYDDQLREGMFKAYSSILRGIKDPKSGFKVMATLMEFSEAVCKEQRRNTSVVHAGVGAFSDLQSIVGSWIEDMIQVQSAVMEVEATN